jgi:hypothetical protein
MYDCVRCTDHNALEVIFMFEMFEKTNHVHFTEYNSD